MSMDSLFKSLQKKLHERTKDIPPSKDLYKLDKPVFTCTQFKCRYCKQVRERKDMKVWIEDGETMRRGCNHCYMSYVKKRSSQDAPDYIGAGFN